MLKRENPAVILISNFTLEECYHKALAKHPRCLDALKERLFEIHLTNPLDIQGLLAALQQGASSASPAQTTTELPATDSSVNTIELVIPSSTDQSREVRCLSPAIDIQSRTLTELSILPRDLSLRSRSPTHMETNTPSHSSLLPPQSVQVPLDPLPSTSPLPFTSAHLQPLV